MDPEKKGTGMACLQSWAVPNRGCVENSETKNATAVQESWNQLIGEVHASLIQAVTKAQGGATKY